MGLLCGSFKGTRTTETKTNYCCHSEEPLAGWCWHEPQANRKGPLLSPFFPPVSLSWPLLTKLNMKLFLQSLSRGPYWQNLTWSWPKGTEVCSILKAALQSKGQEGGFELEDSSLGTDTAAWRWDDGSFWKHVSTVLGIHVVNVPQHSCSLAGLPLLFSHTDMEPHVPPVLSFPSCFLLMWRTAWQPTPVFLLENPMDRGVWRATVQKVAKGSDWATDTFTFTSLDHITA